ncbi:endonuclease domain-containing protein [Microbacterium sp. PMB16]|uniref:endonuclease domain-containing protein n=1 Tax=Microbacterium sp. PMB16 TaxID=3120157 RepID=UPI003F4BEB36
MRHRIQLPARLGAQFSIQQASSLGIRRGRTDAADLARPFHGVRSVSPPDTFRARVDCYLPRMRPGQRFVGKSAARLWVLPYPGEWQPAEELEIAVPQEQSPPRAKGVRGRHLRATRARTWRVRGAPVVDPIAAVFSCASGLTVAQLVVLLDAIVTDSVNYPGIRDVPRPRCTLDDVGARLAEWGRFPGSSSVRKAFGLARAGVESPKETETRLVILAAGLPEPAVQFEVRDGDGSRLVARIDLAYPHWRIAIEYEGDGHRTDKDQWRRDIARQRELEERGWIVIRLTQQDLVETEPFLRRIRTAIAERAVR